MEKTSNITQISVPPHTLRGVNEGVSTLSQAFNHVLDKTPEEMACVFFSLLVCFYSRAQYFPLKARLSDGSVSFIASIGGAVVFAESVFRCS